VSGGGIARLDVIIDGGTVTDLVPDASGIRATRVVDADGRYVLPGAIDAHCHPVNSDKMDAMSLTAALGGITTMIPFIGNVRAWGWTGDTRDIVKRFIEEAERISYLDFGVHGVFSPADREVYREAVGELVKMGVISFKMFMAYSRRGMMTPDDMLVDIMALSAEHGGMTQVHAETGCCIDFLIDQYTAQGKTSVEYFLPSQPNLLEIEAVTRAATFSAVTGSPLYPVHLSTREVPNVIRRFREMDRAPLFAETCPQYLVLTNDALLADGALAKCGPPLREQADNDALWQAVADGTINVIASDSCGLTSSQKLLGGNSPDGPGTGGEIADAEGNIFLGSFGLNTIEFMVPVIWTHGVNAGRITLPRLVQVLCENPAKIFGLWPRKGSLAPGSDADLVIWDPARTHTVTTQHGNTDFSSFEGFELLGMPELVMQRGRSIVEDGRVLASPGQAHFLAGDPNAAAYAQGGATVS
jgi:dihydropyrimidinase